MKETVFPMALAWADRFSKVPMLPKLQNVLLGMVLFGCATAGWAQGGTVVAWGDNKAGQGVVPSGLSDVVAIAAGEWHNLALKADGTVVAWGHNAGIPWDLGKVEAIAAGGYHNFALKADGTLRVWGDNTSGQCNVPAGLNNVVAMAGGWQHSIALKADGTVVGWGDNRTGQISVPGDLRNVVAISSGEYHNLALISDGTVRAWGWNGYGATSVPAGLNNVVAISGGGLHSLALKRDGTVVAWGWNEHGQASVPAGLRDVVAIAGGIEHSLALKSDGTVVGWGANDGWASNDPSCQYIGSPCPRKYTGQIDPPAGLNNVVSIKGGVFHSIALRTGSAVQAPSAPALTIATVSDTSVTVTWRDLANETGYRLEARVGASGNWAEIASLGANTISYQHTGLAPGTTMFYRLRAFNLGGTSPYSVEISATTSAPALVAPTLAATVLSHAAVDLTWNDVAHESGYRIERRTDSGQWLEVATPAANVTTFRDAALAPATTYFYRIRALGTAGNSPFSAEVQVRTQNAPISDNPLTIRVLGADPTGLRVRVSGDSGQRFKVQRTTDFRNWTEVADSIVQSPSTDMTLSGEGAGGFFRTINTR